MIRPQIYLILLLLAAPLNAQTGSIEHDFRSPIDLEQTFEDTTSAGTAVSRKSLWIAGGLSAILPGAGQIYSEAPLWRALMYGVIEGAGWTLYAINTSNGQQATTAFENYAESQWSVARYIDWIASNIDRWPLDEFQARQAREALQRVYRSSDQSIPEWERIDLRQLNSLESAIGDFSHTLQARGGQQYYEMIGKYAQFRAGWADHAAEGDTLVYDPSRTSAGNRHYMEMRATANDYLAVAVMAGGVVMLNHLASMLDAVLTARSYNVSVSTLLRGDIFSHPTDDILLATRPYLRISIGF